MGFSLMEMERILPSPPLRLLLILFLPWRSNRSIVEDDHRPPVDHYQYYVDLQTFVGSSCAAVVLVDADADAVEDGAARKNKGY